MMYADLDNWYNSIFVQSYISSLVILVLGIKEKNKPFLKFSILLRAIEVYFVIFALSYVSWMLNQLFITTSAFLLVWISTIKTVEYVYLIATCFSELFSTALILTMCSTIIYNISISSYSEFNINSLQSSKLKCNLQFALPLVLFCVLLMTFFIYRSLMVVFITNAIYDTLILVSVYSMGKIAYEDYSQRENEIEETVDQQ